MATAVMVTGNLFAQQIPVYSLYMFNPASYNPALSGTTEKVNVYMMNRSHLFNMPGRPVTNTLTADGPLDEKSMGWGLNLYSDRTGISNKLGGFGTYSYRLRIAEGHRLFFGVSMGIIQNNIDKAGVVAQSSNDPLLINEPYRKGTFDGNFGIAYRWNQLEISAGGNQIIGNSVRYQLNDAQVNYNLERHFFASLKYQFFIDDEKDISIIPVLFVRKVKTGSMPQEATLLFNWRDKLDLGLSYKSKYGYGFIAGTKIYDALRIAYSYDIITSTIGTYAGTSHEIMLGYSFSLNSREIRKQQQNTEKVIADLNEFKESQKLQNESTTEQIKQHQQKIDSLALANSQNKEKLEEIDAKLDEVNAKLDKIDVRSVKTQEEFEELKQHLISSGLLEEAYVSEYEGEVAKGYYLVIASVKHSSYNEKAMKKEFLDKGYLKIYNMKRGWHYVYTERTDNFVDAIEMLKKARRGKHKNAWIHILK